MTKKHARVKLSPLAPNLPPFKSTTEHLESFNKLKEALTSAPVLAYPNYNKPFILETDASLKELGAVLTQEDDEGNYCIISYASHTLKLYECFMRNYSSAKLELLVLKWAVCEKFKVYLIGSKFTVFTDNNPLTYVCTSHLGAAQIRWLSNLLLFDFEIKYRAGKSNQAADALSWWPVNPNSSSESLHDDGEWETVSYGMVCQILDHHLGSTKIPYNVKLEVQNNIADVHMANQSLGFPKSNIIDMQLCKMKLFDTITPKQMAECQKRDTQPKLTVIHHVKSRPVHRLLLQYHQLSLIRGILHHHTFQGNDEIQQIILPQSFHNQVLKSLHNDNDYQGLQCVRDLLCSKVYWPTMFMDTDHWLAQCERCLILKGDYTEPKTVQGSLVANQPLELLCIDFTKADVVKGGKENILILTDAFSKYSQVL